MAGGKTFPPALFRAAGEKIVPVTERPDNPE
jgi:hypothetical protein